MTVDPERPLLMRYTFLLLLLPCIAGCGSEVKQAPLPDLKLVAKEQAGTPLHAHSTLADTSGLAHDLELIERKLGPLESGIRDHLTAVEVIYFAFADSACTTVDKEHLYTGILLVHACVADDVRSIFAAFQRDTFPLAKVVPINRYGFNSDTTGWNDAASMADNNTSAFNYRTKPTSLEPSKHTQGIAIDINPLLNPMVRYDASGRSIEPAAGHYDPLRPGTLTRNNTAKYLTSVGWSWGGRWPKPQDHQHIEKSRGRCEHIRFSLK